MQIYFTIIFLDKSVNVFSTKVFSYLVSQTLLVTAFATNKELIKRKFCYVYVEV